MYYVYVLKSKTGKFYYGCTSRLKERVEEHNKGSNISTRGEAWRLVYFEGYLSKSDALKRELNLKKSGQARRWLKERIKDSIQ